MSIRDRCIIIGGIALIAAIALSSGHTDRSIFLASVAAEAGIAPTELMTNAQADAVR